MDTKLWMLVYSLFYRCKLIQALEEISRMEKMRYPFKILFVCNFPNFICATSVLFIQQG